NVLASVGGISGVSDLAVSDDGTTVYAAAQNTHEIVAIDAATLDVKARYPVATGEGPRYLAVSAGKVWFTYGDQWSGNLGSVDPATDPASGTDPVTLGQMPEGVSIWDPGFLDTAASRPGVLAVGETGISTDLDGRPGRLGGHPAEGRLLQRRLHAQQRHLRHRPGARRRRGAGQRRGAGRLRGRQIQPGGHLPERPAGRHRHGRHGRDDQRRHDHHVPAERHEGDPHVQHRCLQHRRPGLGPGRLADLRAGREVRRRLHAQGADRTPRRTSRPSRSTPPPPRPAPRSSPSPASSRPRSRCPPG
ncbi:YncE family protein, partial [Streptomyces sp. L7]